ncbi:hypothetical protein BCV72DRAFT_310581 [Rhizopus microsporus var. microsporus]|uniref:Uncharacterized protein n=1 Tax=Rhizopus microsporus var. microsporus TaxID=86635 RepID=A0A1X0QM69_RHIZD|nr:hypothetical protein BCV72DRAFT_310581 [Rhizopus microsporus var. microsporus]
MPDPFLPDINNCTGLSGFDLKTANYFSSFPSLYLVLVLYILPAKVLAYADNTHVFLQDPSKFQHLSSRHRTILVTSELQMYVSRLCPSLAMVANSKICEPDDAKYYDTFTE